MIRIFLFFLTRRYGLTVRGLENIQSPGAKLILQSHPSHIDPQLLAVFIAQHCDFVPVISEKFLSIPVFGSILKAWNAVPVSDLKHGNRDPNVLKKIFSKVMDALERGKSVLISPSGQIAEAPYEKIKNKQSAHLLVGSLPANVRVVGVRITGLWGSMWSAAWMGERPNFIYSFAKAIFYVIANLIFFLPKRPVTFEFVDITEEAIDHAKLDRRTFNKYLEAFYNVNGPEEVRYVKHFFYAPRLERRYPKNLEKTAPV